MEDALLGTEIGRYRLERMLGEGGMGRVYLGVQPAIGSRVAIKILNEETSRNPELVERFFAEARAVNLIRHENIVSVLDMAQLPDGRPFIIMEFIEGHTLAHHVRGAFAPLGGVAQVVGEVLGALSAAHAIGIVHRDLKPDNVLVTVEGHARVLDFGIAKLAPGLRADVSPRTKTGALLGTPAYMAPEQISGAGNVDARTDIYAAGIVLYEAVTGHVPFQGATLFDTMRAHLDETPRSPREARPDLPPAFEQVILQALAKDPAHRFQSAQAMAAALSHAAQALSPDAWVPLSSRGAPRISAGGIRQQPTPRSFSGPPTAAATAPPTEPATAPPTQRDRPRRLNTPAVKIAALAVIALVVVMALRKGPPASASSPEAPPPPAPEAPQAPAVAPPLPAASLPAAPLSAAPTPRAQPGPPSAPAVAPSTAAAPAPQPSVVIGPNVHIGPGVTINTTAGATPVTMSQPADYNPASFDPVAYLPKALAMAQKLAPDAKLTRFEFDPVFSDGHVDLTMDGRDREYEFRSASASARPADVPRNMPYERACMIHVEVGATGVTAEIRKNDNCNAKLVRMPTCRLAGVWKKARENGTPADVVARIAWLSDEQWFFDVDLEGTGGGVSTIPDRCP